VVEVNLNALLVTALIYLYVNNPWCSLDKMLGGPLGWYRCGRNWKRFPSFSDM